MDTNLNKTFDALSVAEKLTLMYKLYEAAYVTAGEEANNFMTRDTYKMYLISKVFAETWHKMKATAKKLDYKSKRTMAVISEQNNGETTIVFDTVSPQQSWNVFCPDFPDSTEDGVVIIFCKERNKQTYCTWYNHSDWAAKVEEAKQITNVLNTK